MTIDSDLPVPSHAQENFLSSESPDDDLGEFKASVIHTAGGVFPPAGIPGRTLVDVQTGERWSDDGIKWVSAPASGGAPTNASYVTVSADGTLTDERVITPTGGLEGVDGGPGSTLTVRINWTVQPVTLASDRFTSLATYVNYILTPESGSSDVLGGIVPVFGGQVAIISAVAGATITIKNADASQSSANRLYTRDGADFSIVGSTTGSETVAFYRASVWTELFRSVASGGGSHNHTTADGSGVLTNDEHDGFQNLLAISTPSNPSLNNARLFPRLSGNNIQLVMLSATGQECVICTLVNVAHVNTLALNLIE